MCNGMMQICTGLLSQSGPSLLYAAAFLDNSAADYFPTMAPTTEALMIVAVALLVIYVSRMLFKQHMPNLPPGPTALPIIGCSHLLGSGLIHKSFADLARKFGPVMSMQLGQRNCIVASSPEAAKEFLKIQDANFSSRPPLRVVEIILPNDIAFRDLMPVSVHLKKILVRELTSAKRLEASKYIRAEETARMLRTISKASGPIRVMTQINIMSTNVLSRMILSTRFLGNEDHDSTVSEIHEFMDIVEEISVCLGSIHLQDLFNFIPKWFDPQGLDARCRKIKARMDLFYTKVINQHKEDRRKNPISDGERTLLDVVLEQVDNKEHDVNEQNMQGFIWDAFTAGTDTTTLTSQWAMAEVLRNPAVMKEVRSELDRVVGPNRIVQETDIPNLTYIQATVKEVLRLHPVVAMLLHQSINATKAFGFNIPAKTDLFVNVWGIGRDPSIWEKPLEFLPERFLDGAPHRTTDVKGQHFELIPFGAGRRLCPGMMVGLVAVHLQVANLLHAFDWSLPNGMTPENLDMSDRLGATVRMRVPLVAVAKPRLASHLY